MLRITKGKNLRAQIKQRAMIYPDPVFEIAEIRQGNELYIMKFLSLDLKHLQLHEAQNTKVLDCLQCLYSRSSTLCC